MSGSVDTSQKCCCCECFGTRTLKSTPTPESSCVPVAVFRCFNTYEGNEDPVPSSARAVFRCFNTYGGNEDPVPSHALVVFRCFNTHNAPAPEPESTCPR